MPNHIITTIIADNSETLREKLVREYSKEEITKIKEKYPNDNTEVGDLKVDFNILLPRPKDLDIRSGINNWDEDRYSMHTEYMQYLKNEIAPKLSAYLQEGDTQDEFVKKGLQVLSASDKARIDLLGNNGHEADYENLLRGFYNHERYGSQDRYNWSITNWGTKWNAYDFEYYLENGFDGSLTFQTAWAYPEGVFEELSKYTPITFMYADEDTGSNFGVVRMENGVITKKYLGKTGNNLQNIGYALAIMGYDEDYVSEYYNEDNYTLDEIKEYFHEDSYEDVILAIQDNMNYAKRSIASVGLPV